MGKRQAGSYSILGKDEAAGATSSPLRMQKARDMAVTWAGAKTICKKTGVTIEEARKVVAVFRESQKRKNHKEILNEMLVATRLMTETAREEFSKKPSGQSAYQVQIMFSEQRALLEHIDKLKRPEAMALDIIQNALQPLIKNMMQDFVAEGRKTMLRCSAIAETPAQREEIEGAFQELMLVMGKQSMTHYGMSGGRVADILKVQQDDIQRLAMVDNKDDDSNRIPFQIRKRLGED